LPIATINPYNFDAAERQQIETEEGVVVVISEEELERIEGHSGEKIDVLEFLKSVPGLEGVDLTSHKTPLRDIDW
jgi:outer membrane receptor for ferrienterochelin and colicin